MGTASTLALAGPARARAWLASRGEPLDDVESFVVFVGHPRSGGTLVAALLDSHPDAVIAIELHTLRRVRLGHGRRAILGVVLERNRAFVAGGSRWTGYDYDVPGQWQGRHRTLRVMGDKKAGGTSQHLHRHPQLLESLASTVGVPVRVIGVTRHPLDTVARMAIRRDQALEPAVDRYFDMADGMATADRTAEVLWLPHEDLVAEPTAHLRRLLDHVGLDEPPGWLEACRAKIAPTPARARDEVTWPEGLPHRVMELASAYPFLTGYS